MLELLGIWMHPESITDKKWLEMLREMLSSWNPDVPCRYIRLNAYFEHGFTREGFTDLLRTVGNVLEEFLSQSSSLSSTGGEGVGQDK